MSDTSEAKREQVARWLLRMFGMALTWEEATPVLRDIFSRRADELLTLLNEPEESA